MSDEELKPSEDFLNLPDDEIPDYPPEASVEASEEVNDTTDDNDNTEGDDDEHDEAESVTDEDEGDAEGSTEGEDGEGDSSNESDEDSEEGESESESESGSEASEDNPEEEEENKSDPEQVGDQTTSNSKKGKVKKGASKASELEATVVPSDGELKKLFAPFKANGHDMQVSSVDDAITLMKMGANYNKKMQGLKPNLRLMKMLDNNKLLDEEKLSYLIDLQNKNPQAIAKLVKDSGFDSMNYDEDNTDYTPGTYTVNEKEVDLDMVLEEIKDTPSFQKTIDTISNKWDAGSRKLVEQDPSIIRVINDHVENGMYDQIMNIVQNEKSLNRLTEMSDLQAYKYVGDTLQAEGAFAQQPQANVQQPTQKKSQDPKLKNRKKAAANTRSKPAKKQMVIDPLQLSDEDFAKLDPALV